MNYLLGIKNRINDIRNKGQLSIYRSLLINVFYAVFKAITALLYHSPWFGTLAFYYIMLSIQRFLIVMDLEKERKGKDEWRVFSRCGFLLLILSIALYGASVLATRSSIASTYPGHLIYLMAAYVFYNVFSAVYHLIQSRKLHSPIISAARILNIVVAIVSLYSLQASMLEVYSSDALYTLKMNAITGTVSLGIVILIGLYMTGKGILMYYKKDQTDSDDPS